MREFNVINEPWIRIENQKGEIEIVSLRTLIEQAHNYRGLCGEVLLQDFAILRNPILTIFYTAFERYDLNGKPRKEKLTKKEVFKEIKEIWNNGKLPVSMLFAYLESEKDRFWLIDDEKPWMQEVETEAELYIDANKKKDGMNERSVAKLVGDVFEGDNKKRILSYRRLGEDDFLDYAEATRWLIYINLCDDGTYVPRSKSLKKGYFAWGNFVFAKGENLFETILLNFNPLDPNFEKPLLENRPSWECEKISRFQVETIQPQTRAELMSFKYRRMRLISENGKIKKYILSGHHYFNSENYSLEMNVLQERIEQKNQPSYFKYANIIDQGKLWRNFSSLFLEGTQNDDKKEIGIVKWIYCLKKKGIIPSNYKITFETASLEYGTSNSGVKNMREDSISIYSSILGEFLDGTKKEQKAILRIVDEIQIIKKIADLVAVLEEDIAIASGIDSEKVKKISEKGINHFYDLIDEPFRNWLQNINLEDESISKAVGRWKILLYNLTDKYLEEKKTIQSVDLLIGRTIKKKNGKNERRVSLPESIMRFQNKRNYYLGLNKKRKRGENEK
ncbi:CRISPR type I-e/-associated protein casa/cse1 [Firmicutes bacterium M10-2]|nr:CRISPR type I-e/-associated protein casa/cse1 [Firmicutes bacterium M10-2]